MWADNRTTTRLSVWLGVTPAAYHSVVGLSKAGSGMSQLKSNALRFSTKIRSGIRPLLQRTNEHFRRSRDR
jgi:hypothetical protein